ncbi:MAG: ATP-binding protein [bacterium]
MEGATVTYWRKLTEEDLRRMRVPRRYWSVRGDEISDEAGRAGGISARAAVRSYMGQLPEMRRRGVGLVLWGTNGTGKTSIAVFIAMEFRRRGNPVLYAEAADLKRLIVEREMFDEDQTFWDRALNVDVLVLDDLGKGTQDSTGFGARIIDELIRHRNANRLVTIITTNMSPDQMAEELKVSSMASLKEHAMPVHVCGIDRRDAVARELQATLRE